MTHKSVPDYTILDRPEVLTTLFHPRPEPAYRATEAGHDVVIPVTTDHAIGGRWHMGPAGGPNILFFHGNGEIVADYDELGPLYNSLGINLMAVDYRGYGRSSGSPSVSGMMMDCHAILRFSETWLKRNNYSGPVMGFSFGLLLGRGR